MSKNREIQKKPKDKEAEKLFKEIQEKGDKVILENERILDNQTILISFGILLEVIFSIHTMIKISDTDIYQYEIGKVFFFLFFLLLIFSCASLILCIIAPAFHISKRRELKEDIGKIEGEYSVDDLKKLEEKHLGLKNIKGKWKFPLIEKFRLSFILITIILFLIFNIAFLPLVLF